MSGATVEFDFFQMEKQTPSKSQLQRLLEQRKTVGGVQTSLSTINPQLLKTVIQSGAATGTAGNGDFFRQNSFKVPSEPPSSAPLQATQAQTFVSDPPVSTPNPPLTIFYDGKVSVFDVSRGKAEIIMKLAEKGKMMKTVESVSVTPVVEEKEKLPEKPKRDFPMARKKSLQGFLEKRKHRLNMVSPYIPSSSDYGSKVLRSSLTFD